MRNRMIAGNWKMNKPYAEGVELAQGLADELKDGTGSVDVVIAPPTVDLKGVSEVIEQTTAPFALSAQNVYFEEKGAYTGETAPDMLTAVGCTFCIIGHSERRGYFGETDEDINKKAKALMACVQGDLQAVGFVVDIQTQEWAAYLTAMGDGNFQIGRMGWIADYPTMIFPYAFSEIEFCKHLLRGGSR